MNELQVIHELESVALEIESDKFIWYIANDETPGRLEEPLVRAPALNT